MMTIQSDAKRMSLLLELIAEPPADRANSFEHPEEMVEDKADSSDNQHGGNDQIVSLAGVARINHKIAEAGVDGHHFGGHHDQPGYPEGDAHADENLWQGGRNTTRRSSCVSESPK